MKITKRKNKLVFHMLLILFCMCLGWFCFAVLSIRFGIHPGSWRTDGAKKDIGRVIDTCYTGNDNDRTKFMLCVQKKLVSGVQKWGLIPFMSVVEGRIDMPGTQARSITQCHDLAHAVGWAAVIASGKVSDVLPQCTNACVSGCQHGAISAWYGMGQNIIEQLPTICEKGIDWSQNPEGKGGCFHEVGHAVSSIAGSDIKKALSSCDKLPELGRIDCGHGVFMELFEPATFTLTPIPLPSNHPHWCKDLWEPYRKICYNQAGAHDYGRLGDDAHAFGVCLATPLENQAGCFRNLGQNIFYVYQYKSDHLPAVEAFCKRAGDKWFLPCISGVLASTIYVEPSITTGPIFCRQLVGSQKEACFSLLGDNIRASRSRQDQEKFCSTLSLEEQAMCLSSPPITIP
jgi:hypothetical protein